MKIDYSQKTYRLSLSLMCAAMTLVCLYIATLLSGGRLALYFLAGMLTIPLISEKELGTSILMFGGTYLFSLLLVPDFTSSLPYLLLFGHYGIVWYFCGKTKDKLTAYVLRLVYCNIGMVLIYFFASQTVMDGFLAGIPMAWRIVLAQAAFLAYDFLYGRIAEFYRAFLRDSLLSE